MPRESKVAQQVKFLSLNGNRYSLATLCILCLVSFVILAHGKEIR